MNKVEFKALYLKLRNSFGFLDWWPGETADEIIIGAILTQNTNWKNVEKAIENLRKEHLLNLKKIAITENEELEQLIKPSGFYRQKAKRLKKLARYISSNYEGLRDFFKKNTDELRKELLSQDGIGMETADSILLYAGGKPLFVIDAYTRRSVSRILGKRKEYGYEELQELISRNIRKEVSLYKDFHAQFVELGKSHCRKKPVCKGCPLNSLCAYAKSQDVLL